MRRGDLAAGASRPHPTSTPLLSRVVRRNRRTLRDRSAGRPRHRRLTAHVLVGAAVALVATLAPVPQLRWVEQAVSVRIGIEPVAAEEAATPPGAPEEAPPGVEQSRRVEAASLDAGRFDMIGLSPGGHTHEPMFVRTRTDGEWSEWMELEVHHGGGPDDGSAEEIASRSIGTGETTDGIWVGGADAFEVNLPEEVGDAEVILVRNEQRAEVVAADAEPAGAAEAAPPIHTRSAWGARPARSGASYGSAVRMGVVHHSVTGNGYSAAEVPAIIRSIQAYHMDGNGWSDIGYNFVVDRFGRIWEGRGGGIDRAVVGAHAGGFNTGTVGVMLLGDFTNAVPSAAALDAAGRVIGWKLFLDGADPSGTVAFTSGGSNTIPAGVTRTFPRVIAHRDVGATGCPGSQLYSRLGAVRSVAKADYDRLYREHMPFGSVDVRTGGGGTVTVQGWVIDPDVAGGTGQVRLSIPGRSVTVTADGNRPDVAAVYPAFGPAHGFTATLQGLPPGRYRACVTFLNPGPGVDVDAGCSDVSVGFPGTGPPVGRISSMTGGPGAVTVTGWVVDPDTHGPADVRLTIAGRTITARADRPRNDLTGVPGAYGNAHGFEITVTGLTGGTITACLAGVNVGPGEDLSFGCTSVNLPTGRPFGSFDVATWSNGTIEVAGWAIDPDTTEPVDIEFFVDGVPRAGTIAFRHRPDVGRVHPLYGDHHGFSHRFSMSLAPGPHEICVRAVDTTDRQRVLIGCKPITVPGAVASEPKGAITAIGGGQRTIGVAGWALDTANTAPVWVWIVVDDQWHFVPANRPMWGLAFFYPRHGDDHGYAAFIRANPGARRVCVASFTVDLTALAMHACHTVGVAP